MTRARERGGAKAFFRRPRHQRLPASEQGGKEKKRRRKPSRARAQRRRARAPQKKHEKETSRPSGNKEGKPRGKAAKRNRTDTHGEKMAVERKRAIDRRAKKVPAASALSLRGMMRSPRVKVEKKRFALTPREQPRGLRRSVRRPWRRKRCHRRSPPLHRRGRVRRGAHVARCRCRAPHERVTKCAFRRR